MYGICGVVVEFDVVKVMGLFFVQDMMENFIVQEVFSEGKFLMVDGYIEVEGLVGRIVIVVYFGKRFYVDVVCIDMIVDSFFF